MTTTPWNSCRGCGTTWIIGSKHCAPSKKHGKRMTHATRTIYPTKNSTHNSHCRWASRRSAQIGSGAMSRSSVSARASRTDTVTITPAIPRLIAAVSNISHPNWRDNVELNRRIPVRRRLTVFSHEIDKRSYFGG